MIRFSLIAICGFQPNIRMFSWDMWTQLQIYAQKCICIYVQVLECMRDIFMYQRSGSKAYGCYIGFEKNAHPVCTTFESVQILSFFINLKL